MYIYLYLLGYTRGHTHIGAVRDTPLIYIWNGTDVFIGAHRPPQDHGTDHDFGV